MYKLCRKLTVKRAFLYIIKIFLHTFITRLCYIQSHPVMNCVIKFFLCITMTEAMVTVRYSLIVHTQAKLPECSCSELGDTFIYRHSLSFLHLSCNLSCGRAIFDDITAVFLYHTLSLTELWDVLKFRLVYPLSSHVYLCLPHLALFTVP